MSYANGLSPFRGKVKGYLLPVDHFKRQASEKISSPAKSIVTNKKTPIDDKKSFETDVEFKAASVIKTSKIKIENTDLRKGVSSLSMSSIKLKKEAKLKSSDKKMIINNADDTFDQEKLLKYWKSYIEYKNLQGENNIAALLEMGDPELSNDFKIILKTSNSLSQIEIKKEIPSILRYLGDKLNNYKIHFDTQIEEQKKQEYIVGIREKYDHLMKINPEIEVLKKEFNLDF